jgi:large subunit ribosomal protein L19
MSGALPEIQAIEKEQYRKVPLEEFRPGDTVRVHYQIVEGDKQRIQVFQGVVIRIQGKKGHARATFTVRKVFYNIGVERTFLYNSPRLEKIEVVNAGKVRQSRLFYMRGRRGKRARIKERMTGHGRRQTAITPEEVEAPEAVEDAPEATETPEEEQE